MRKLFFSLFFLIIFSNLVLGINATGLDGNQIEITKDFCSDTDKGMKLLGDDFVLFCEGAFFDKGPLFEEFINKSNSSDLIGENEDLVSNEDLVGEDNLNESEKIANWHFFLSIIGVILIIAIFILIIAHKVKIKKDEQELLRNLKPYVNSLQKKGYNKNQLEILLIQKGYDVSFINKLLK